MNLSLDCKKKWEEFPAKYKAVFAGSFLFGILAHGFAFFNIINNHDNLAITEEWYEFNLSLGRWGYYLIGDVLKKLGGGVHFIFPALIGVFTLFIMAVIVCLIVDMFRVKSELAAFLLAGVTVTFPTLTAGFLYMWTSPYVSFSFFLSVLGVWVIKRWNWGGIPGSILFAFSTGVYQANIPFVAVLFVLLLLVDVIEKNNWKESLFSALGYFFSMILGLVLYLLGLKVTSAWFQVELSNYKGLADAGNVTLGERLSMIKETYRLFFGLPFQEQSSVNITLIGRTVFLISIIFIVICIISILIRKKLTVLSNIMAVIYTILFPVAVNSIVIMCNESTVYVLMVYAIVAVLYAPMILLDKVNECTDLKLGKFHGGLVLNVILNVAMLIMILDYAWQANGNYVSLYYANEQAKSYFTTLVTEIKSTDGYKDEYPIAIIGVDVIDEAYRNQEGENLYFRYTGNPNDMLNIYTRQQLIEKYTGFYFNEVNEGTLAYWQANEEVKRMACYPDDGSIKVIDGVVIIKFSDYLTKQLETPY